MSILLVLEPNSNSSISESSELKSENFFFSFKLVCLAAIAAGLSGKPVTGATTEGGEAIGTFAGAGEGSFGTAVEAGDDVVLFVGFGVEKKVSSSLVEASATATRRFLEGAARVLVGPLARSFSK